MKTFRNSIAALLVSISAVISLQAQDVTITNVSSTPVNCGGVSDGTITVTVTGGVGLYTYLLVKSAVAVETSGAIASQTYTFTGHPKYGSYIIIVSDSDDDTGDAFTFASIGGPDPIAVTSAFATDITCNGAGDGTIQVTATGEEGHFIFELNGPVNETREDGFFTGLIQGDYTVTVSDRDGCPSTDVTPVLTVQNPTPVSIDINQVIHVECFGEQTGSIAITPGGGTPSGSGTGYSYAWTGPDGFTSPSEDITNLGSGDYFVTVYDGNMCAANLGPITVNQPPQINVTLTGTTDVTCHGGNDGAAFITVTGGTGGYTYQWEGQSEGFIFTDEDPVSLVADVYDLTVTDGNNCSRTFTGLATIEEPDPFSIQVVGTTDVSCHGGSDGSASITPTGGTPPYTFSWSGAVSGYAPTDEDPSGMPADSYSLTITDSRGCSELFPDLLVISEPGPITVVVDGTTNVSCFGGNDGSAEITVTGGTPPFTFSWTGDASGHPSAEEDPDDLVADTYDLVITDANGCVQPFDNLVTIDQPSDITVDVDQIVHVDCYGEATGSIDITTAGGTPVYSFSWTGPNGFTSTSGDLSNLEAGTYNLTVTDARGCMKTFDGLATVNENSPITATFDLTNISCSGGWDGAIDATVTGGVPPYLYGWTGPSGFTAPTEDVTGLQAGNYRLTVTDGAGCIMAFPLQTLTEPAPIDAEATQVNVDCFGAGNGSVDLTPSGGTPPYTFAWTGPSSFTGDTEDLAGIGPGAYSVTVTDAHLCSETFTNIVSITEPPEITVGSDKTDISCAGLSDGTIDITPAGGIPPYSFSWSGPASFTSGEEDLTGLSAGSYSLTITDANLCTVIFPNLETIAEPPPIAAVYVSHQDVLCNGDAGGSVQINATGGTPPLVFNWTNSSGVTVSADEDPAGLPAGTYSLTISDASGCSQPYPDFVTITQPPPLIATLAGTNIQCFGDGDGTITVTATGGTPPYEYSREGNADPAYQPANQFTGLGPGLYTIWTRDANMCVVNGTITISESPQIQVLDETVSGEILCHGDSSVQISVNEVTGGVAPYEYSVNGGMDFQSTGIFPALPAGTYQTVIQDALGCTANGGLHVITQPDSIRLTLTIEDITTCYYSREGRITVAGSGGTGSLTYTLNDTLSLLSGDFQNLPGGLHRVEAEDENGCTSDTSVTILAPPEITVTGLTISHVTGCSGGTNGSVTVSGTGGTGTLTFALNGGPFQAGGTFSGLAAGVHTVTLKDNLDCTRDTSFTISEPAPISITEETVTDITCSGFGNGTVRVTATGGTTPLTYTLSPGMQTNETGTFGGLSAGTYTVTVNDAEGCGPVPSSPLTVHDPPPLVLDYIEAENISCYGSEDGRIGMSVSGGIPPYEYSVDNQSTWSPDSLFTGLPPGSYEVFIRDANLCLILGGIFTFTDPPELTLDVTPTHITTCSGDTTGMITAMAAGGTGDLLYTVDGLSFQDSGIFHNLTAGTYPVYVEDENGCSVSAPATILEPDPVVAVITKTDATFGNLGSITISGVQGGTPPYEFTIEGPGGPYSADTVYDMLEAGTYHVVVRDQHGCTYEEPVEILDVVPLDVMLNISHVTCFGYDDGRIEFIPRDAVGEVEYSIDSGVTFVNEAVFTNLPGNITYDLVARDEEGKVFAAPVTINEPGEITLMRTITPAECNAYSETGAVDISVQGGTGTYTYLWSDGSTEGDRTGLAAGSYVLEITDSNNCIRTDTVYVNSLVIVQADAGADTTICPGGTVQLNGQGGHTSSWEPAAFLSDPSVADPLASFITHPVTYVLTITEEISPYGCYNTDSVRVDLYPNSGINATEDTFLIRGSSLQLNVEGGPFSAYRWDPSTGLDNSAIPDPVASPVESILYFVFGTNQYGCEESDSVFIEVIEDIRAYNVFSPNGDGVNDFFDIENAWRFPEMVVEVYSRWGDKLFSSKGYDDGSRWDGTARGKDVPVGTYYYVIIPYSGAKPITGNVTIIR